MLLRSAIGLLALWLGVGPAGGAQPVRDLGAGWYEAEGLAPLANITPAEARRRALREARDQALMFAVGVDVQNVTLWHQQERERGPVDAFYSLGQQVHAGRIIAERAVEWTQVELAADPLPVLAYRVRLQVKIAPETGRSDPDFAVRLRLNKEVYRAGDEMTMEITATKSCYLTVFCLTATDTVVVLLPHRHRAARALAPGDTLRIPDRAEREMGIRYRVVPPAGAASAVEAIKVVATRSDLAFTGAAAPAQVYNQIPTSQDAVQRLLRWLVRIPRDQRSETQAVYRVVAAQQGEGR